VGRRSFTEQDVEKLAREDLQRRMKSLKLNLQNQGLAEESQSLPSFGPDSAGRGTASRERTRRAGAGPTARPASARTTQRRTAADGKRSGGGARAAAERRPRSAREPNPRGKAEQLAELGTCKVGDTYRVAKKVMVRAGPELDSERLSTLTAGETLVVLETWQSREGQLRVRCDAGWTSVYSKDGASRLLQKTVRHPFQDSFSQADERLCAGWALTARTQSLAQNGTCTHLSGRV